MLPRVIIRDDGATVKTQYSDTGHILVTCERWRIRVKRLAYRNFERTHRQENC